MPTAKKTKTVKAQCVAVVDIGSNSVRLVLYKRVGKRYECVKDKKSTCRLALGMNHLRPALNPQGMKRTLQTLQAFKGIIQKNRVSKVLAIATAAMRAVAPTSAGKAFHRKAEKALGHKIEIVSGRQEARLTAYGLISFMPKAVGICGDLGGGSLELAAIDHGRVLHTSTVAIGTLTLLSETRGDPLVTEHLINRRMRDVDWLQQAQGRNFYAIGGSWRAVGRLMMKKLGVSSKPVHGFAIQSRLASSYALAIARQNSDDFQHMPAKISHRADIIPGAAATLAKLIALIKPRRIIFSGHGVRDGLVLRHTRKTGDNL